VSTDQTLRTHCWHGDNDTESWEFRYKDGHGEFVCVACGRVLPARDGAHAHEVWAEHVLGADIGPGDEVTLMEGPNAGKSGVVVGTHRVSSLMLRIDVGTTSDPLDAGIAVELARNVRVDRAAGVPTVSAEPTF
jgi:hypothetical protein